QVTVHFLLDLVHLFQLAVGKQILDLLLVTLPELALGFDVQNGVEFPSVFGRVYLVDAREVEADALLFPDARDCRDDRFVGPFLVGRRCSGGGGGGGGAIAFILRDRRGGGQHGREEQAGGKNSPFCHDRHGVNRSPPRQTCRALYAPSPF